MCEARRPRTELNIILAVVVHVRHLPPAQRGGFDHAPRERSHQRSFAVLRGGTLQHLHSCRCGLNRVMSLGRRTTARPGRPGMTGRAKFRVASRGASRSESHGRLGQVRNLIITEGARDCSSVISDCAPKPPPQKPPQERPDARATRLFQRGGGELAVPHEVKCWQGAGCADACKVLRP